MSHAEEHCCVDEEPHVIVIHRGSNRGTLLAWHEYESVRSAWMAGAAFWTGVDGFGNACDVKLGDVVAIIAWNEQGLERLAADQEAERQRDITR